MVEVLCAVIPLVGLMITFAVLAGVKFAKERRDRNHPRESPLVREMLRGPGHTLRVKLEDMLAEVSACIGVMMLIPFLLFSIHVSQSYFGGAQESVFRTSFTVLVGIGFMVYSVMHLRSLSLQRKHWTLGLEGELATAEELNLLMLSGCRVFHDVPFQFGNIDHVVVSPSGVFTIETKMIGKPKEGEGKQNAIVDYDLGVVRLPDREFRIPVEQLEAQKKWLSGELTKSVGQPITVESILALPGWFVERKGSGPVAVINPRNPQNFIVRKNVSVYSATDIQRIAYQLDQKCRNIKPSYRNEKTL